MKNLEELSAAIQKVIEQLEISEDSLWAHYNVNDLIGFLSQIRQDVEENRKIDKAILTILFAPTGSLQEVSIENSWGTEYLRLAELIDQYSSI